jgi:hypothetical protein
MRKMMEMTKTRAKIGAGQDVQLEILQQETLSY